MRVRIDQFNIGQSVGRMHYIGGVGDYDVWVRDDPLPSDTHWDVAVLPVDLTPCLLLDLYASSNSRILDTQNHRIESAKFVLGEDGFRTALAMIKCFAPHVTITHPHLEEYNE